MASMIAAQWRRSEAGSQLIEFMLVFPILMLLVAGLMDFGMLMRNYEAVTNAAREGARVAVLPNYNTDANVQARVQQYLTAAGLDGVPDVDLADQVIATPGGSFTARVVTVAYDYQFAILDDVADLFGGEFGTVSLQARSVMRAEAQAAPAP